MLLLRVVAIGKRRDRLKDAALAQYRADLDKRLDRLLSGPQPTPNAARRLFRAMRRDRGDLFRFVTRRDVPYANNVFNRPLDRDQRTRPVPALRRQCDITAG